MSDRLTREELEAMSHRPDLVKLATDTARRRDERMRMRWSGILVLVLIVLWSLVLVWGSAR